MQKPPKLSLLTILKEVPDPRVDRRKLHSLPEVLCLAICALLCGADSFEDMEVFGHAKSDWFETFLDLPHGIPSHDTFNRVFAALDPEQFLDCFIRWTQSLRAVVDQELVALDGKALRRAINQGACPKVGSQRLGGRKRPELGPTQGGGQKQRDHGRALVAAGAGAGRVHRDAGCDGLPEEHRPGDQGGRCRVRAGPQREPRHGVTT